MDFSHIKDDHAQMVDISGKNDSIRIASARGGIKLRPLTIDAIRNQQVTKGNVLATARIAAILAVKKTPELIPMCHQVSIDSIDIIFDVSSTTITVEVIVKSDGKTGVEMDALTGVSAALLTIWDMVKSAEKDETGNYPLTMIQEIKVISKTKEEKLS
ncbi:MAG: cyclic pyranopterin monophosphate synthase MoaC [Methanosarcinales archaeon]|nr:MAG: cyclic pyranopterin monophosphate synthase MoaC [Methanosarcinales archaeon]